MKKAIQVISLVVAVLSFVFLLYGCIKLARVEAATVPQDIESGIPGVEIVQPSNVISKEDAQLIVGFSVATLGLGVAGYFISSQKGIGEANLANKLSSYTASTQVVPDIIGVKDDMPQERISPVKLEDFPRVVEVWEASVRETHRFLSEADIQFFKPLISNELPHIADLVCVRDEAGQVAGFVGVANGKIEMLFIHPTSRQQGSGRQLLEYAVKKLGATKVDVNEQNEEALEFYKRMGFEVEGRSELDSTGRPFPLLHLRLGKVA